jgi:hypothetical protein
MPAEAIGVLSGVVDRIHKNDRNPAGKGLCCFCRFCRRDQGVDEEAGGRWPAAAVRVAGWLGIGATEVAVLLEEGEGWVEVGGFAEAAAWGGVVGGAAGELLVAGAVDPVQEPAGVVDAGVGAHQVEHRQGVVGQVASESDRAGEGFGSDRTGPAVAEMGGEMQ